MQSPQCSQMMSLQRAVLKVSKISSAGEVPDWPGWLQGPIKKATPEKVSLWRVDSWAT